MKDITLSSLFAPIAKGFRKYNLTIFIVVFTTGLAVAVLLLNATLQQASDPQIYTQTTAPTTLDQATIDKVKQLHASTDTSTPVTLPTGRINPFAE